MLSRLAVLVLAGFILAAGADPSFAQSPERKKAKANELFKKGMTQFNLGRWEEAIDFFQRSYEEYPSDNLLFNIAQAYRHWGQCGRALFFYKRFLAVRPNTPNRTEVEGFIDDLEETCKRIQDSSERPPLDVMRPEQETGAQGGEGGGAGDEVGIGSNGDDNNGEDASIRVGVEPPRPELIAASFALGPAFVDIGESSFSQVSFALGVGYPLAAGPIGLELGGLLTYTPVPWDNQAVEPAASGTAGLTGLLANVGAVYPIFDRFSARGDLGIGMLVFSGVADAGAVFVEPGRMADGALSMFHLRMALGLEYAINDNLVVSGHPVVFSYSPGKDGLREDITAITRFDLLLGVGYKL